ncbi:MAG: aminodeoxychorismate/anthranilate synthase component II [Balneolaceae bacterium]|nr:MAG: aminodeoxychorismate/anthranilate synthase component II [Balneolaceae bacterium]
MVLIIDNYDSFTYNLVHLVAQHTDSYEVHRNDALSLDDVRKMKPDCILISPGPGRPHDAGISEALIREFGKTTPILGVCLGHQAIGEVYGAEVVHAPSLMHGKTSVIHHDDRTIFNSIAQDFIATRYHSLVLDPDTIPEVLEVTSRTPDGVIMGVRHREYPVEGIQFHPESILTTEGPNLIRNWLRAALKK